MGKCNGWCTTVGSCRILLRATTCRHHHRRAFEAASGPYDAYTGLLVARVVQTAGHARVYPVLIVPNHNPYLSCTATTI